MQIILKYKSHNCNMIMAALGQGELGKVELPWAELRGVYYGLGQCYMLRRRLSNLQDVVCFTRSASGVLLDQVPVSFFLTRSI